MTNEEMEILLRQAGHQLPGPAKAAPLLPRRKTPRLRPSRLAAVLVVVLLLSITAFAATAEVPIPDASEYGQWTGFPCSPDKYGLKLEDRYGDYVLSEAYEMWIVPRSATYLQALSDATYRAGNFDYCNYTNGEHTEGWGEIGISAGRTDHPYWRAYYSLDGNDVPVNLHDMTIHTHRNYTLYCGEYRSEYQDVAWIYVKWVDYEGGYVYSLTFDGAMEDKDTALEFTKQLIDDIR